MTSSNEPRGRDQRQGPTQKPSVPLEKLVDRGAPDPETEAADRLASEAAKAPSPEVEGPDHTYPEGEEAVADLVENKRRQKS